MRRQATLKRTPSSSCVLIGGSAHTGVLGNNSADHSMQSSTGMRYGWWHDNGGVGVTLRAGGVAGVWVCCVMFEGKRNVQVRGHRYII